MDFVHAATDSAARRRVIVEVDRQRRANQVTTFLDLGMRDFGVRRLGPRRR